MGAAAAAGAAGAATTAGAAGAATAAGAAGAAAAAGAAGAAGDCLAAGTAVAEEPQAARINIRKPTKPGNKNFLMGLPP
jgi:hypothetical protein